MRRLLLLLTCVLLLLAGCTFSMRPIDDVPDLSGQIQEVGESRILVRGPAPAGAANPRLVWVRVTKKTKIATAGATGAPPRSFDALTVGTLVHVWFDGPVRESYPEQADGRQIIIRGIE